MSSWNGTCEFVGRTFSKERDVAGDAFSKKKTHEMSVVLGLREKM